MNYYNRNPGDKAKATPHLSMQKIGALALMEDWCYGSEKLLPDDEDLFFSLVRARTRQEQADAIAVRAEFFERTDDGWINHDIEAGIIKAVGKSGKASRAAKLRWSKRNANASPNASPNAHANALQTQCSDDATRARPSANSQKPLASSHSAASADASAAAAGIALLEEPSGSEKKEGATGAEIWLDVESDEARRAINRALGRDERRAFVPREMAALQTFAAQHDGMICPAHLDEYLRPFLMAEPRYDQPALAGWSSLPKESLLLKRKRYASNVLDELGNQLDFAIAWRALQKKERRSGRHPLDETPNWDWEATMRKLAPAQGWDISQLEFLSWRELTPNQRELILEEGEA